MYLPMYTTNQKIKKSHEGWIYLIKNSIIVKYCCNLE